MLYLSKSLKKQILVFGVALMVSWIIDIFPTSYYPASLVSSMLYAGLIIVWAVTRRMIIADKTISRFLLVGAAFLVLLFVLRICKWELFDESDIMRKYLWYAFYIPFVITPMFSLSAAFCIDRHEKGRVIRGLLPLWAVAVMLCLGIMANDLHGFMFKIEIYTSEKVVYSYGVLYYITFAWCILITVFAFIVLMRRCTLSMSRRLWYIPVLSSAFFFILIVIYYLVGGAPRIGGFKLYNLQEVYAFLYVFLWESCIVIGLIPSNTGYEDIFMNSAFTACISDASGNILYRANRMEIPEAEQLKIAESRPVMVTEDVRLSGSRIKNGFVFWEEDISSLNELRDRIAEAAKRLAEENTLLEFENKTKEEFAKVDIQNKLYDEIAVIIKPQLKRCGELLKAAREEPQEAEQKIATASLIGAYIKRRTNLAIIAHDNDLIDTEELYYSIRESLEYLSLGGVANDLRICGRKNVPAEVLISFYGLFEEIAEICQSISASVMVNLYAEEVFRMCIMTDARTEPLFMQSEAYPGVEVVLNRENDTVYVEASYREGGAGK